MGCEVDAEASEDVDDAEEGGVRPLVIYPYLACRGLYSYLLGTGEEVRPEVGGRDNLASVGMRYCLDFGSRMDSSISCQFWLRLCQLFFRGSSS